MKSVRLSYVLATLLAIMAIAGSARLTSAAPLKQTGPTAWTVLVGSEAELQPVQHGQAGVWQIMKFYPDNLTINVGDTIDFKLNPSDSHTVLFLAPGAQAPQIFVPQPNPSGPPSIYANPEVFLPSGGPTFDGTATTGSGQLGGPPTNPKEYKLTFTKAGSFDYFCSFHSRLNPQTNKIEGMTGKVVVQDAGSAYPKSVDQVNSDTQAAIATDQANVVKGEPDVQKLAQATRPGPNGTTIYQVNVGGSNMAVGADYMRFYPSELTVHQGDSVEWVWHGGPHTVLFASGGKEPDLIIPQPQPNGPPKLLFNPQIAFPLGGDTYNGTGLFNSGTPLNPTNPDGSPVTYKLTFTQAGTFEYICAFHDPEGMVGHITVLTSAAPLQQATDPASVLVAFEKVIGSQPDIDSALGMFADNATLKITPAPQGTTGSETGKGEIRQGLENAVSHKVHHTLNGTPQVNGNTTTVLALVTNNFFQHLGVAPVQFQITAVVEGGKITGYTATITPAEGRRVAAAAAAAKSAQTSGGNQPMMPQTGSGTLDNLGTWGLIAGTFALAGGLLLLALRLRQRRPTTSR